MIPRNENKNVWWLYQGRRVNTQTAGAGGALRTNISFPAGQVARLLHMKICGPAQAGSATTIGIYDEDVAECGLLGYVGATASVFVTLPSIGGAPAHSNYMNSMGLLLGPGESLGVTASAADNTQTLTIGIVLLLSTPVEPTWGTTGSGGTPSLAASTISAANTLQAVVV